jgi:hypothetical protein
VNSESILEQSQNEVLVVSQWFLLGYKTTSNLVPLESTLQAVPQSYRMLPQMQFGDKCICERRICEKQPKYIIPENMFNMNQIKKSKLRSCTLVAHL